MYKLTVYTGLLFIVSEIRSGHGIAVSASSAHGLLAHGIQNDHQWPFYFQRKHLRWE